MSDSNPLDPYMAARMAHSVYAVIGDQDGDNAGRAIARRDSGAYHYLNNRFDLKSAVVAQGTSGIGRISQRTGFAMVLPGDNEVAVVTRGTDTKYDWLTNIHSTWTAGPAGHSVHTGFNNTYESISGFVDRVLKKFPNQHVHCVGHSLGGALANLFAARFTNAGRSVSLYTFGSPRVGMNDLSAYLESKLQSKIYRVYNKSDPVPLVPIYPFVHAPYTTGGMCVSGGSALYSVSAHSMKTYSSLVKTASWKSLSTTTAGLPLHAAVDKWLDLASENVRIPGSSAALWLLSKILIGLVDAARAVVGIATTIATSVADLIAALLLKAASLSKVVGERLMRWISLVMRYLGKKIVVTAKEVTRVFLNWLLELLLRPVLSLARRALDLTML